MLSSTLLLAFSGLISAMSLPRRQQLCNGKAEYCDRKYSNVSWIGTHNAPFVGSADPENPFVNQEVNVTQQLDAGIRFLTGQTHELVKGTSNAGPLSELYMCHTSCALWNAGPLATFLTTVKTWIEANPNEVVTLLLTNGDNVNVSNFDAVFESTGFKDSVFVPSTTPNMLPIGDWPTYGELISSGKRVVVFLDYGANASQVPYILDEFQYFFETPFTQTNFSSLSQCALNRPPGGSPEGRMYLVNHVLDSQLLPGVDIPDDQLDSVVNAATGNGSILYQADICTGIYGRVPNVMLLDMFDRGDGFPSAQNTLNGV